MTFEVEQKFPVDDLAAVRQRLLELGFEAGLAEREQDQYFAHPNRDYLQTDEALRLRRSGEKNVLTYKGPKIDPQTKTRREEQVSLADGSAAADAAAVVLGCLGFRQVGRVVKTRTKLRLQRDGHEIEASLDEVDGVGDFLELEIQAPGAELEEAAVQSARAVLLQMAAQLAVGPSERRGYLELGRLAADARQAGRGQR